MLGYPNHAGFKIEERMAKTRKVVLDVLGDLKTHLTLWSAKEIKHLKDLRKQDLESCGLEVLYYGNKLLLLESSTLKSPFDEERIFNRCAEDC